MRILPALLFLSVASLPILSVVAESKDAAPATSETHPDTAAKDLVMSETNLDRTEEKLRQMENEILQQLVSGKPSTASSAPAVEVSKPVKSAPLEQVPQKEKVKPVEPPAPALEALTEKPASIKVSVKESSKSAPADVVSKPAVTESDPLLEAPSTLDSLRLLEDHPAIESRSSGSKSADRSKSPDGSNETDNVASDKLLIAESQVKILSKELETTRQSLRSAERRIDELSNLVHSTYSQDESQKGDRTILPEFFDGEDTELPAIDDGARAALAPKPPFKERALPASWVGATSADIATISADHAPVRVGPSRNESTIFTLDRFHQVKIELRSGEWYRVITNSGSRGWIAGQALTFGNVDSDPNSSVRVRAFNPKYEAAGFQF